MKVYIKSSISNNNSKSFGFGPIMKYDGERIRKTNLKTDKNRIVYEDVANTDSEGNKKLYYKYDNRLHRTYYCYCYDPENPNREFTPSYESSLGVGYYK